MLLNKSPHRARGFGTPLVIGLAVVVLAAALGVVLVQNNNTTSSRNQSDLFLVHSGSFDVTVPASGELVAMQQIEVRNRLESRATIMEIIDEGKTVEAGELLLRLNDEEIRNRIKDAEDSVNSAESSFIASEANLAIRQSAAASELERAELNVELTRLALEAWREGEDLARREQLTLAIETAKINYERLRDRYDNSKRLFAEEFISADELRRDEIAMIEADARLKQAMRDISVYRDFTYVQQKRQKNSDVDQAVAELARVKQRHEAELETARADVISKRHQLDSRRERLNDLRTQLEFTEVRAPSDGLVVYASSMESHRRGSNDPPQVGTDLSRNELVMVLPDTSRMIAAVKINEALSGLIKRGQRARINSDALPDATINGEVLNVGVLAETGGWRDPNRRDYTVRILLHDTQGLGLRPSMRARAEIFIDSVVDALHIPVQSVHREGRTAHVYVPVRGGFEARSVRLGRASELYVEVLEGLSEGDYVLMRQPQSGEVVSDARVPIEIDEQASQTLDAFQPDAAPAGNEPAGNTGDLSSADDASSAEQQPRQQGQRPGGSRPSGGQRSGGS